MKEIDWTFDNEDEPDYPYDESIWFATFTFFDRCKVLMKYYCLEKDISITDIDISYSEDMYNYMIKDKKVKVFYDRQYELHKNINGNKHLLNFYKHCDHQWESIWSCEVNDRCPTCNVEIEPFKSVEL